MTGHFHDVVKHVRQPLLRGKVEVSNHEDVFQKLGALEVVSEKKKSGSPRTGGQEVLRPSGDRTQRWF